MSVQPASSSFVAAASPDVALAATHGAGISGVDEVEFPALERRVVAPAPASVPAPAEADAAPDLSHVQAQLQAEFDAARDAGQQQGYQEGLALARQQVEAVGSALTQAEALRAEQFQAMARRLESEALTLAFDLAEALLADQLEARPAAVLAVIRGALDCVAEAEEVHLMLNPADLELIGDQAERLAPPGSRLHLRSDPALTPGGCRVESDAGDVDASREGQVSRLREQLAELRDHHAESAS